MRNDRYARLIAARQGVEMLWSHASERPGPRSVRVESEDDPGWDDLVEELTTDDGDVIRRGWQVKLQTTALEAETLADMLRRLHASQRLDRGRIALPFPVNVKGVAGLSALRDLSRRASQRGCDTAALAMTQEEQRWWEFLAEIARFPNERIALLGRVEVQFTGDEQTVESSAIDRLLFLFRGPTEPIFRNIESYFSSVDDCCVVTAEHLHQRALAPFAEQQLPAPATLKTARARYLQEVRSSVGARRVLGGQRASDEIPFILDEVRIPLRPSSGPSDSGSTRSIRTWLEAPQGEARTLLLFGEVGSGKTELLTLTAAELAADAAVAQDGPIPLLIDARALAAGGLEHAARTRWPAAVEEIGLLLQAATLRWIVLLDGLDEAGHGGLQAADALRRRLGDRLHALVISTRPSFSPSVPGATEAWLRPWTAQETELFLMRWREHDPEAVDVLRRSPHRDALSVLCANPLTATLCLLAARRNCEDLRSRAGVYTNVVEGLFDDWARARAASSGEPLMPFSEAAPVLRQLALEVVRDERSTIPRQHLARLLRREARDRARTADAALELDLGVLVRRGDAYEFAFRGLAEHLAGQQLLDGGDEAVVAASFQPWSGEVCRHAIGWAALTDIRRAIALLNALLRGEQDDDLTVTNAHLRPVLIATRAAADLGEDAGPIAEQLMEACQRRLMDETSLWIGDRVADAVRELMRAGARCWAPLEQKCVAVACDHRPDRAAWFNGRVSNEPDPWMMLLFERDPEVRRVAVERLGEWVDEPRVRSALVVEIQDADTQDSASTPAIAAGLELRRARRDAHFIEQKGYLVSTLERGGQLSACAAAVALLPNEADPSLLAAALREGAVALYSPPAVVEELARSEGGLRALDRAWPRWREDIAKERPARSPLPPCPGEEPPASRLVRNRLIIAVAPALRRRGDIQRLLDTGLFAVPDALCALAYDDPALVAPLLQVSSEHRLPLFSAEAQEALGRAALGRSRVRAQLLDLWASIDARSGLPERDAWVRQRYPGHALEPLVRNGDTAAIDAYSEWLSDDPDLMLPRADAIPLPPEILAPEPIREAARAKVDFTWHYATRGIVDATTGERSFLMSTTAAAILHHLWPVWHHDMSLRAELAGWLLDKDVNRFNAALIALEGLSLPEATQDLVVRGIAAQMRAHEREVGSLITFVLPRVLRFIHRTGMTHRLAELLWQLIESETPVACHAAAVLIPLLGEEDAARLSRMVAEGRWLHWEIDLIDAPLLRRMVELAPEAWASALEEAIGASKAPIMGLLLPFLADLPPALKRRVLFAWAGSVGQRELPWSLEGNLFNLIVRPADRLRQLLFDHGLDHESPVSASEADPT